MRVVITQSNYLPWRGWFDQVDRADVLVLYDSVQFTKRDWRNRNRIRTTGDSKWLTVPVRVKGRYDQPIDETEIERPFARQHSSSIRHAYAKAAAWPELAPVVDELFAAVDGCSLLSQVNERSIRVMCDHLSIDTAIRRDREFDLAEDRVERLIGICRSLGATEYLSGPAAKSYMDVDRFHAAGIHVAWMDYSHYEPYEQVHPGFDQAVSMLDTVANLGFEGALASVRQHRPIDEQQDKRLEKPGARRGAENGIVR